MRTPIQSAIWATVLVHALVHALIHTEAHGQSCGTWLDGAPLAGVSEGGSIRCSTLWDPDGPGPLGNHVVVAGDFDAIGGVVASNIAMWNPVTDQWSALGTGTNSWVLALAVMPDNTLVAGGIFTACGTTPTNRIASWNGTTWSPLADFYGEGVDNGVNNAGVYALALMNDGRLAVGGLFATAGGVFRSRLAV